VGRAFFVVESWMVLQTRLEHVSSQRPGRPGTCMRLRGGTPPMHVRYCLCASAGRQPGARMYIIRVVRAHGPCVYVRWRRTGVRSMRRLSADSSKKETCSRANIDPHCSWKIILSVDFHVDLISHTNITRTLHEHILRIRIRVVRNMLFFANFTLLA
jgi:hypothetical protein